MQNSTQINYELIRKVPVAELLALSDWELYFMEQSINAEVSILKVFEKHQQSEIHKAKLARQWIQGIRRIKNIGGKNGK